MLEPKMMSLEELRALPKNPKLHALGDLGSSFERWGFVVRVVVNQRTQHVVSGNGRIEELLSLQKQQRPPQNVEVQADGAWLIPVDVIDIPEEEELSLAIAINRLEELGGWDNDLLALILKDLPDISGTGFTAAQIQRMTGSTKAAVDDYADYEDFEVKEVEDTAVGDNINLSYVLYVSFASLESFKAGLEVLSLGKRQTINMGQRFAVLDGDELLDDWKERLAR